MTIQAPTGLAATRSTTYPDNEATVSWSLPAGALSVTVERTWDGGETWLPLRLGVVTSYTFRDQQPDTQYGYRVSCSDAYTTSPATDPVWLWTTPAAPTLLSVTRVTTQYFPVLRFAISSTSSTATGLLIQSSLDGTSWFQLFRLSQIPATYDTEVSTYTARPHRIAVVDATGQQSAWSPVVTLAALSTPPAPTGLLSAGFDPTLETSWSWVYTSGSDGSAQSAYEINVQYSTDSGETWSAWYTQGKVWSTGSQVTWPAGRWDVAKWYRWQVRVWAASTTPSAWSASQEVHPGARPAFGITSPTENQVLATTTLDVQYEPWTGLEPLLTLYSAEGAPLWLSTSFMSPPPVEDGESYTLRGRGVSSDGILSDEVVRHFSVQLARPTAPTATVTIDPATVSATIHVTNPPGGLAVEYCEVWRGTTLVGTCAPNGSVVDRVPPLGVTEYRVAAVSSLPSRSWVTVTTTITAESVIINGGAGLTLAVVCPWNPELGLTVGRDRVSRRYDGVSYPVVVSGTELSDELTFSFVTTSQAPLKSLGDLVQDPAPTAYWRDPTGRAFPVGLGDLSYGDGHGRIWTATLKMQRVAP